MKLESQFRRKNQGGSCSVMVSLCLLALLLMAWSHSLLRAEHTLPGAPDSSGQEHEEGNEEGNNRFYRLGQQQVVVHDFEAHGYILDIGGGGEGVIGRLKGQQVIAIDISKRELEDAPAGPLKVIMDARDLQFLDGTFNTTTSFFTLMYIDKKDHEQVFREIFRVLNPGGSFLIWDVLFPKRTQENVEIAVVPLRVKLPDEEFVTGYGGTWPKEGSDLAYYRDLAEKTGFQVVSHTEDDLVFYLELRKP